MPNVLFVCTGNVCRSPMAEGLLRGMTGKLKDFVVASAGLSAINGRPPSQYSIDVLREEGLDIERQLSQQLTPKLVAEASHIFAMTIGHKEAIEMLYPAAAEKTFLVREFVKGASPDDAREGLLDVPDPIGMGRDAYEMTRDLIKDALPSLLKFVEETAGS